MIALRQVTLRAGAFELAGIDLEVSSGEYAVLMGRTGCGKTTLLETVCGLIPLSAGHILIDGRDVSREPPGARGVGYVPQDGALFPTMTVREHLDFALRIRRWSGDQSSRRVSELAEMLSLTPLLERLPAGLSGGERQRVALGRALSFRPSVLCLDEPLSALDEATREEMYEVLSRVRQQGAVTTLHVTHSSQEARRLADRVFQLDSANAPGSPAAEIRPESGAKPD